MTNKELIAAMEEYVKNIPQGGTMETYETMGMKKLIKFAKEKARVIKFVTTTGVTTYDSFDKVPFKIAGYTEDQSEIRAKGGFTCNAILDNRPMYEGFIGPMLDGIDFRYETQEVYDMLST